MILAEIRLSLKADLRPYRNLRTLASEPLQPFRRTLHSRYVTKSKEFRSHYMQTIKLGPSGPVVPALGIGTWAWGDKLFWNYGSHYGSAEVESAFQATLEAGVNFFDTAEVYGFGESEKLLGQFMKQTQQPVQIATKYGPAPWRIGGKSIADALTESLKRLQVG